MDEVREVIGCIVRYIRCMYRGLYAIRIGQSGDIEARLYEHRRILNHPTERHINNKLQNAWDFHGESAFVLEPVLLVFDEESLNTRETAAILAVPESLRYNIVWEGDVGSYGPEWQERFREGLVRRSAGAWKNNQAEGIRRLWATASHREKMAAVVRRTCATPEWREKNAAAVRLTCATPEWKAKHAETVAKTRVPVVRLDTGEVYESITAAARAIGVGRKRVTAAIRRKHRCAGIWFVYEKPPPDTCEP